MKEVNNIYQGKGSRNPVRRLMCAAAAVFLAGAVGAVEESPKRPMQGDDVVEQPEKY